MMEIIRSKNKPDPIETDSRGSLIKEGIKVAYNKSGDVKIGTIKTIVKNEYKLIYKTWHLHFKMEIVNIDDESITTIKNFNSFVII